MHTTRRPFARHRSRALNRAVLETLEERRLFSALVVNTLSDAANPTPGDMTLRQAIYVANLNPGPDAISFAPGLTGTIALSQGELELTDTTGMTTINGPGADTLQISGERVSRVMLIASDVSAAISGLGITNGVGAEGEIHLGPSEGGGFFNWGTLVLASCILSNDTAGAGGAIFNQGSLDVTDCAFSRNSASGQGGAILSINELNVSRSSFSENSATSGGAIYAFGSFGFAPTVTDSSFASNIAQQDGGAICLGSTSTNYLIIRSTFSGNSAGRQGGGHL